MSDASVSQGARLRALNVNCAEMYIDRARECKYSASDTGSSVENADRCSGFKRVEDLDGECEQLMKKAIIAKLRGDETLAEEWAQNHNRVWEEGMGRIMDSNTAV